MKVPQRMLPALALALALASTPPVRADTVTAITGFSNVSFLAASDITVGFAFSTSSTITVTDLGVEVTGGSLAESHAVGIFGDSGLLVSAIVAAGAAPPGATDANNFEYVPVTPTLLAPGTYRIGAYYSDTNTDRVAAGATSVTASSPVTYEADRLVFGPSLGDPISPFPSQDLGYFGPNFKFTTGAAAVPEPSALALAGLALVSVAVVKWRTRARG